jgi:azurin
MNVRSIIGSTLIATTVLGGTLAAMQTAAPAKKAAAAKGAAGRLIEMTGDDAMKFNVTTLTAKPGERLTVKLTNIGKMPKIASAHNFVLLAKGTDVPAFGNEAVMAAATEYIPAKFKAAVLASTKLAGPGETVEVTFTAPTAPGVYQYICSFPGHYAIMKGTLEVK